MSNTQPVVVVGGGPVGLAAALELARFGVPTVVLEQHESTSRHPKTRNLNTRTMEIARGWGRCVYERLRAIDTPEGWKSPIRFLRSVVGDELGRIDSKGFVGPGPDVSPALPVMSSQDLMERIFCDAARATGLVDLRFGHQLQSVARGQHQADDEVEVEVLKKASGTNYTLGGAALVAADGVDSAVRTQLGIELEGSKDLSYFINCYFRADVERHVGKRTGVLFFVANESAAGVLQPLDARGRWLCQIAVTRDEWDLGVFNPERCKQWIRAAVGVAELDPEILSVGRWRMNATVADRLLQGRIVFVGDAAHQFPPTGGLGVNTGLQGMHNAMWKLAFHVRAKAGRGLLASYDVERRPVARWTAEQSLQNHRHVQMIAIAALAGVDNPTDPADVVMAARRYGNHLGVEFGSVYASQAVVPDGTSRPEVGDAYSDYAPSACPGCRAPHAWLGRNDGELSILDLFGAGFTLLTTGETTAWPAAAVAATRKFGVPVSCYAIGAPGLEDRDGVFLARYGIEPGGAVLVRPDGYVAWRVSRASAVRVAALDEALQGVLG